MNERIRELAGQSYSYASEQTGEFTPEFMGFYDKKFAELIVRECAKHIRDRAFQAGAAGTVIGEAELWLADDLEEHFGVEE